MVSCSSIFIFIIMKYTLPNEVFLVLLILMVRGSRQKVTAVTSLEISLAQRIRKVSPFFILHNANTVKSQTLLSM